MATAIQEGRGEIYEGEDAYIMHRVILPNGDAAVRSDFTDDTSTVNVYDITNPANATKVILSDTVVNTTEQWWETALQTDGFWTEDGTGYNFKYHYRYGTGTTAGQKEAELKGGHTYRFEFAGTTTGTDYGILRWVTVIEVRTLSSV